MDEQQVRLLAATWGVDLDESGVDEIAAYLTEVLEGMERLHEIDLEGVPPWTVARAAWK